MRHPDEGEIHAWLDGALDPATAAGLEAHVAACPTCSAAVAEARGLIAGASRILMALDGVPGGVLPAGSQPAGGVVKDDLAALRSEHQRDTKGTARRPVPWYARRSVQVAAGLMLMVGVGGVVARNASQSSDQLTIEFESVPSGSGPSVGRTSAPAPEADAARATADLRGLPGIPARAPAAVSAAQDVGEASSRAPQVSAAGSKSVREEAAAVRVDRSDASRDERARVAAERVAPTSIAATTPPPVVVPQVASPVVPAPPMPTIGNASGFAVGGAAGGGRQNVLADTSQRRITVSDSIVSVQKGAASAPAPMARLAAKARPTATTGVVSGIVTGADNAPLGGAMVRVPNTNIGTVSAPDGSFELSLPPGQHTLEARRIGYAAATAPVRINAGETATASIALQASALSLSQVVVTGVGQASTFAGACFTLDVTETSTNRGIPLLPRRVQFRLSDSDADAVVTMGGASRRLMAETRQQAGTPSEPAQPLAWSAIGEDSVEVKWPTDSDIVTLILHVRGSNVSGTAQSNQPTPLWTASVRGRKVTCAR